MSEQEHTPRLRAPDRDPFGVDVERERVPRSATSVPRQSRDAEPKPVAAMRGIDRGWRGTIIAYANTRCPERETENGSARQGSGSAPDECGAGVDSMFRVFADHTRLRILRLLRDGPLCVGDLVSILRAPQPTVSRHLAYLRRSGFVKPRQHGLWMFYELAASPNALHGKLLDVLTSAQAVARGQIRCGAGPPRAPLRRLLSGRQSSDGAVSRADSAMSMRVRCPSPPTRGAPKTAELPRPLSDAVDLPRHGGRVLGAATWFPASSPSSTASASERRPSRSPSG